MTLRPNVARLLERPIVVLQAEEELRIAAACLKAFRGAATPELAAACLAKADRHTTAAWKRLDEVQP